MRRREFLAAVGLSLAFPTLADQRMYRLAYIHPGRPSEPNGVFFGELEKRGYREGQNLKVERYYANASADRLREMIATAVSSHPDVIYAISGRTVLAVKAATATIPVVGIMSDPIAYGIVNNLSRPGGNITGTIVDAGREVWEKRLELLKEIAPTSNVIFLVAPRAAWESAVGAAIRSAAAKLSLTLVGPPVESPYDSAALDAAFSAAIRQGVDAAIVSSSPENMVERDAIVRLAATNRLPTMYPYRSYAESGGLVAYDIDLPDLIRRAASQVAQILRGTPAGDIPFQQATRLKLILNLRAANTMQLTISPSLLARADEVIE